MRKRGKTQEKWLFSRPPLLDRSTLSSLFMAVFNSLIIERLSFEHVDMDIKKNRDLTLEVTLS